MITFILTHVATWPDLTSQIQDQTASDWGFYSTSNSGITSAQIKSWKAQRPRSLCPDQSYSIKKEYTSQVIGTLRRSVYLNFLPTLLVNHRRTGWCSSRGKILFWMIDSVSSQASVSASHREISVCVVTCQREGAFRNQGHVKTDCTFPRQYVNQVEYWSTSCYDPFCRRPKIDMMVQYADEHNIQPPER